MTGGRGGFRNCERGELFRGHGLLAAWVPVLRRVAGPTAPLGRADEYLEDLGHDPDLRSTIEDFKEAVAPFAGWLYDQMSGDVARLPSQQRQASAAWRASIQ